MRSNFFSVMRIVAIVVLTQLTTFQFIKAQTGVAVKPADFFGFEPGSDRNLFNYEQLIAYLQKLDEFSPRLEMREIGKSPMGKPMYILFISSDENIKRLDELAKINKKLALDADLPESEVEQLINDGKVFFLATLSMHSTEVGPTQSAPLIAFDLATTNDPSKLKWLQDVVYMMVPNHNPDGMDMIVEHYQKYKGTKYEDSDMPGVYHKYVGHDNNRDFVTLTQSDTKAISDITSKTWFPQVMVEKHQMGIAGVRYFVPPNHDPIAENIDEGLWNWNGIFGSSMIKDLTKEGCSGVAQRYAFDNYWPGSTETCLWKNVNAFLTEAASCNIASPIFIEPSEITVRGKGLSEYKKSSNMPLPWPGGWWRLSDIVKMEIVSTNSILNTCAVSKNDILKFRNALCKKQVELGKTQAPFYYIMPVEQHDRSEWTDLARLLTEHGINVYKLTEKVVIAGQNYEPGAFVVPLSQPFRAFIKEVMEVQEYPVRHYTIDSEIIKPYDITSWSLPLHKGVSSVEIKTRSHELENSLATWSPDQEKTLEIPENTTAVIFDINNNASYKAVFMAIKAGLKVKRFAGDYASENTNFKKGSFVIFTKGGSEARKMNEILKAVSSLPVFLQNTENFKLSDFVIPRIALVESWYHDMDAGWTRYVFDNYDIPFTILHPGDFEKAELEKSFDAIVFPDEEPDVLMTGKFKSFDGTYSPSSYPPEFTKGIGEIGFDKILKFIDNGGLIVSWSASTGLFNGPLKIKHSEQNIEEFALPVQDISKSLSLKELYCPGSLLKINVKNGYALTLGMEEEIGVFYRGKPVFKTREPYFDMDRRIVASFPEKEILKSGYIENVELLSNKPAMVWIKKGKGQLVLFSFSPQFRASTPVSYKLLFNALLLPDLE